MQRQLLDSYPSVLAQLHEFEEAGLQQLLCYQRKLVEQMQQRSSEQRTSADEIFGEDPEPANEQEEPEDEKPAEDRVPGREPTDTLTKQLIVSIICNIQDKAFLS